MKAKIRNEMTEEVSFFDSLSSYRYWWWLLDKGLMSTTFS